MLIMFNVFSQEAVSFEQLLEEYAFMCFHLHVGQSVGITQVLLDSQWLMLRLGSLKVRML